MTERSPSTFNFQRHWIAMMDRQHNHPSRLFCACFGAAGGGGLDLSGADPAVRFQDDLFHAANGGWLARTEIPSDKSRFGAFSQLGDLSDQRLRDILDELTAQPSAAGSDADRVATFFAAFLDTEAIDQAGLSAIQPQLAEIDAISNAVQLAQWQGRMQGLLDTPVALWVMADFKQPDLNRALTWQGGLGLPDRDYYLQGDTRMAETRAAYAVYLTELARLAGEPEPAQAAATVLAIEHRIALLHWDKVENRQPVKLYNPRTLTELMDEAPGFDWSAFLEAAGLVGEGAAVLSISQPSTVIGLAQLFAQVPLADWKLYFKLHLLDQSAPLLPLALRTAHFAFRGQALTGATAEQPRWQLGVAALNRALGETLGKLYVARHFTPEHKARMQLLVENLLAAFRASIAGLAWMSPQTQALAQDKLSKYSTKIGYPDHWQGDSGWRVETGDALGNVQRAARFEWQRLAAKAGRPVDRREWGMTPQTVNAYYNPSLNEIVFPAAILQPPFFDMAADDAANYGAIGAVIGHEISHGFDDQGSQFDGDGVLCNWWTDADRQAFDAVTTQLVAQYESYAALPGKTLNGRLTLGENIADLSGLQIAFRAYQASQRANPSEPAAVLGGYTGEQRFFIAWARVWREKVRDERALQLLTTDPHSPAAFRANGAAVNHDGFHAAFSTQPGDDMFKPAPERLRIW
ncbi:MAG: putative endopeptidase [Litorivivens sp.]